MTAHDGEPRLPPITARAQVPDAERHRFDAIVASRGSVPGPFRVLLHRPVLAGRIAEVGASVRFEGILPAHHRELAILTTARYWSAAYVWAAHEPIAREAGVDDAVVEAVAADRLADLAEPAASIARYVRAILEDHSVTPEAYRAAQEVLDSDGLIELTATVGYYSLLACVCLAFEVRPADPPIDW